MPLSPNPRVYIFGASGTGSTTLGAEVASELALPHVDSDDHYWAPVEPPFSAKRAPEDRVASMSNALGDGGWVLSGACHGWGNKLTDQASLIVFVTLPTPTRIERLRKREKARFGHRIDENGDMFEIHKDFIKWVKGYDDPSFHGRNLAAHETWLDQQSKRVVRIEGRLDVENAKALVIAALHTI